MGKVSVNGTKLYYEEKGKGQALLFIHGMCGDARVWADQMERLSPHFRCIAYDRRGHTRSPLGKIELRTVELHADDAAELIRELKIEPCILVGSSGGARVGLDVMRRYPEMLRGAALSEPPVLALDPDGAANFLSQLKPSIESAMSSGDKRAGVDAFFEFTCPGLWKQISDDIRDRFRDNAEEMFGDLQMPVYSITKEDLTKINCPCLIISGSDSHPLFRNVACILKDSIPGAKLTEIKDSGHVTYFEKPIEFASAVASFAETL
ncbi:MAG: alpha/beta fold hydrolase [Ignavibacteria bacterium]